MNKQHILEEIKRVAAANGGKAPGHRAFARATGINASRLIGRYWAKWSDAIAEAGLTPNDLTVPFSEQYLIEKFIALSRELGHLPAEAELRLKKRHDPTFPNSSVFLRRLGNRSELVAKVRQHCRTHAGFEDVIPMCGEEIPIEDVAALTPEEELGFVYMLRSGKHYKIGKTNAFGRRERELAIQLPEKANTVHVIKTDDPSGIEAYWHTRFASKRANGEWFALEASDVKAFKRRRFM